MKVLIIGSTGLVGKKLLENLLTDDRINMITCLVRSLSGHTSNDKLREIQVNFDHLEQWDQEFEVDCLFCCLGTTIKKAGSKTAFKKVDYEYIVKSASLFSKASGGHFLLISSIGADSGSSTFYSQVKGETEKAIKKMCFNKITILRPSLLLGERNESRPMESLGKVLAKPMNYLLQGSLKKYRGVEASEVASLMKAKALNDSFESSIEVEHA